MKYLILDYNFISCTISILLYLFGLSFFQILFLKPLFKLIGLSINLLYLLSALLTYLLNSGTTFKGKKMKKKYCKDCNFNYPYHRKLSHCTICGICVIGIDHHCGVFGKCIANRNIFWFYCFIFSTFISIFSCIGTLVYIMSIMPF